MPYWQWQKQVDKIIWVLGVSFQSEPQVCHDGLPYGGWFVKVGQWTITSDQRAAAGEKTHVIRYDPEADFYDRNPEELAVAAISPVIADGMARINAAFIPGQKHCECEHGSFLHFEPTRYSEGKCLGYPRCNCKKFRVPEQKEEAKA